MAYKVTGAEWIAGLELVQLYSAAKPHKHLYISLGSASFHLAVGHADMRFCTLVAKWARGKKLRIDSYGMFNKDDLFTLRDELLDLKFAPYIVHARLDPFFQALKEGPLEERTHRCTKCTHTWSSVVRVSSGDRVNSLCAQCGSGGVLVARREDVDEDEVPPSPEAPSLEDEAPDSEPVFPVDRPSRRLRAAAG
jgi:hypothetical protein